MYQQPNAPARDLLSPLGLVRLLEQPAPGAYGGVTWSLGRPVAGRAYPGELEAVGTVYRTEDGYQAESIEGRSADLPAAVLAQCGAVAHYDGRDWHGHADPDMGAAAFEIARQFGQQIPGSQHLYEYDTERPAWLAVHFGGQFRTVTATYVEGIDLYDVAVADFSADRDAPPLLRSFQRVFCDELGALASLPRHGDSERLFTPKPFIPTVTVTDWPQPPAAA